MMKPSGWIGVAVLVGTCLAGSGVLAADDKPAKPGATPEARATSRSESQGDKININVATKTELMKLQGVGASTAQKIIAYRDANGPFKRPEDLAKVEGLAKGVLEKNAGRITVK